MNLTRYLYTGPQSAVSLRVGDTGQPLDVQLLPDKPVELPADHEYTVVLLALKHLAPLPTHTKLANKSTVASQKPAKE
ncbi:hypothetical protein [Pseudomonas sp. QTF5]|uniref:hypothetical protein n=1 Tax=Pseudomonas sp. QTF5 TaxID=1435425 RepID=UPI0004B11D00|nr:hypothetical protein [Pseudomonas sp. QTF5]